MTTRPYKPADMPGMMPYLTVADPGKSLTFYESAFGFESLSGPMKMDGKIVHAVMKFLDTNIMMGPAGAFGSVAKSPKSCGNVQGASMYVYCEDVDAMHQRAVSAGAEITMLLADQFWGDRVFQAADPDGYRWTFAQNVADFDPASAPG